MGFDLWRSPDGWYFSNVTSNGLGNMFNYRRAFYRKARHTDSSWVRRTSTTALTSTEARRQPQVVASPQQLQIDQLCGGPPVLSWQAGPVGFWSPCARLPTLSIAPG